MKHTRRTDRLLGWLLWIPAGIFLFPILLVVINSFKSRLYISSEPFALPDPVTFAGWDNYLTGLRTSGFAAAFGRSVFTISRPNAKKRTSAASPLPETSTPPVSPGISDVFLLFPHLPRSSNAICICAKQERTGISVTTTAPITTAGGTALPPIWASGPAGKILSPTTMNFSQRSPSAITAERRLLMSAKRGIIGAKA